MKVCQSIDTTDGEERRMKEEKAAAYFKVVMCPYLSLYVLKL